MKSLAILCLVLIVILIISFLVIWIDVNKIKSLEKMVNDVILENDNLHIEIQKYQFLDEIKSNNRRKANEKINNLYDGDSIDNAINILRNNKNK